jgi:hypothetical protein
MELGFDLLLTRFEPYSFVFQAGRCPEIDNVVTAALCRPIETSSDIDDNKRARHRWSCRRRNGTKPKFFNDFSRARACTCARGHGHPELGACICRTEL